MLLLSCISSQAFTWYVSSGGTETNGTYTQPWGVLFAVTNTNPHLSPGDTVVFKSGTWTCAETNTSYKAGNVLHLRKSGTPASKIIYRPESLWGFSFDGGLMLTAASNLVVRDFRIFSHLSTNRTQTNSGYTLPPGITEETQGNEILHNLIENTGHPGIASWRTTRGKNIRGNVIRFVGFDDWIDYAGANRGSGMYLQNADDSAEALVAGNISYFNYTTGMKAYGNTDIWKFTFKNQICVGNSEAGIFYHLDNYASSNFVASSNYLWMNGTGLRLGYPLGNGGHSNAVATWNYVVDAGSAGYPFYVADGWRGLSYSNNIGVSLTDRYLWQLEVLGETSGSVSSHHFGGNAYYSTNTGGIGAGPFLINETSKSLAQWQAGTGSDPDATHSYTLPSANVAYVFSPSTDPSFVHSAVFNWAGASNQTISVNSFFEAGDIVEIFDAQNIPTSYATATISGSKSVELNLGLTNRAAMLGTFTQRGDSWSGFDSRIRAFVLHKVGRETDSRVRKRVNFQPRISAP